MKLIDKDALVAWAKESYLCENASMIRKVCYKQLLEHLDTLEVKEVDLEKEIDEVIHNYKLNNHRHTSICSADIEWIAEHFFELGLKTYKEVSFPTEVRV